MSVQFEWYFGTKHIHDIDEALAHYGDDEFKSPTRSTVPLLSLLKHGGEVWKAIVSSLISSNEKLEAHLEHQVKSPRGSGTPSHTDLMLLGTHEAVAIEAKWTEPRYPDVRTWRNSANRESVLDGWFSLVQPVSSQVLLADDFQNAVYQMVHRAASACSFGRRPTLVYLQFTPLPNGQATVSTIKQDLTDLHSKLGSPKTFKFSFIEIEIEPTSEFDGIKDLPKGLASTAVSVMAALKGGQLFRFKRFEAIEISIPKIDLA